jgi:hypothetical protein
MSSLALYRALVPSHADVVDTTVDVYLELAARRHSAASWGQVYPEAMVLWAAHRIERTPGLVPGSGGASTAGPITSQTDGDLSRSYGAMATGPWTGDGDADLRTTRYGLAYLDLRDSRAGTSPGAVVP